MNTQEMTRSHGDQAQPGMQSVQAAFNRLQPAEQTLLATGGVTIAAWILTRRPLLTLTAAATGGYMLYRNVTGHCPISEKVEQWMHELRSYAGNSEHGLGSWMEQLGGQSSGSHQGAGHQGAGHQGAGHQGAGHQGAGQQGAGQHPGPSALSGLPVHGSQASSSWQQSSVIPNAQSPRTSSQQVDEASKMSFPASDPPSYSAGTATPKAGHRESNS
jgi:hypothetical protein